MARAEICAQLARFPIWMRPFVWGQLVFIRSWQMRCRCPALIEACRTTGRLRIVHVGDAPRAADVYHHEAPAKAASEKCAPALPARECTYGRAAFILFACIAPPPSSANAGPSRHVLTSQSAYPERSRRTSVDVPRAPRRHQNPFPPHPEQGLRPPLPDHAPS